MMAGIDEPIDVMMEEKFPIEAVGLDGGNGAAGGVPGRIDGSWQREKTESALVVVQRQCQQRLRKS